MALGEASYDQLLALFLCTSILFTCASSGRLSAVAITNVKQDLITRTCHHTIYFDVCISSLSSDPRSATADLKGLATIAHDISIREGKQALTDVSNSKTAYSQASNFTQYESRCLGDCPTQYSEAIDNLEKSRLALRSNSFEDVNDFVSAAMTASDACSSCFAEEDGEAVKNPSPGAGSNQYFIELCSNLLAITKLLG